MSETTRYVRLELVAECFEVEVAWLEEVAAFGLIAHRRVEAQRLVIELPVDEFDRLAVLVFWHRQGIHVAAMVSMLASLRRV